mmetsp:Transcript_44784/g.108082  ORF Transcript_44784/g.108082 Transcript_44784/m.108082 type:complete len:211 (+) Transcript_44784:3-635(+)
MFGPPALSTRPGCWVRSGAELRMQPRRSLSWTRTTMAPDGWGTAVAAGPKPWTFGRVAVTAMAPGPKPLTWRKVAATEWLVAALSWRARPCSRLVRCSTGSGTQGGPFGWLLALLSRRSTGGRSRGSAAQGGSATSRTGAGSSPTGGSAAKFGGRRQALAAIRRQAVAMLGPLQLSDRWWAGESACRCRIATTWWRLKPSRVRNQSHGRF